MQTHVILEFSPTPLQNTSKMELIPRKDYLRQLRTFRDTQLIKVITGVRRCGKTTLMTLFINELKAGGIEDERIVRINFEDYDAIELTDPKALHAYLKSKLQPGKTVYFFLDEIQNVSDFQRVIDSLYIRDNVDIYLTGSNGTMLSSDLATLLSGRYVEIKMLPMSFGEFGSVRISVSGEVIPGAAQRGCPLYLRCSMPDLMR